MAEKRFYLRPDPSRPRIRDNIVAELDGLPRDKVAEVRIKCPHKEKRNNEQNKRFHATCNALAQETGYTPDEVKRLVKDELNRYEIVDGPLGKRRRYESSANWNKTEMAEATEILNRWCLDLGVPVEPERIPEWVK